MRIDGTQRLATIVLTGIVLAFGPVRAAKATVTLGTSNSYAANVSVTFTPLVGRSLTVAPGPVASIGGVAPAPYKLTAPPPIVLSLLTASAFHDTASSNVDGLPGVRYADADSSITSLVLGPVIPTLPPLITLTITNLSSTADVTGDFPSLTATGNTTLGGTGLVLTLPGIPSITFSGTPRPNTQIGFPSLGVSVLLDEQILSGNGVTVQNITVNGLDITFKLPVPSPVPGIFLGTLSGSIVLAHSEATLLAGPTPPPPVTPVPEPPSSALVASGALVLVFGRWWTTVKSRSPTRSGAR